MKPWAGVLCIKTIGGVDVPTLKCLEAVYSQILRIVISLGLLALLVMLTIGGFKFLTSGGDQKQVEAAKGTISHAIAGLVVLIAAYVIIQLIANLSGAQGILQFKVVQ